MEINGNETQTYRNNKGKNRYIGDASARESARNYPNELLDEKQNLNKKKRIINSEINVLETKLNKFKYQVEEKPFEEWLKTTDVGILLRKNKGVISKIVSGEYFSKSLTDKQITNLNDNEKKIYDEFLLRYKNSWPTKGGKPKHNKKTHKKHPKYAKKTHKKHPKYAKKSRK